MADENIFNTIFFPSKIMEYFERHHIFPIFQDLMVLIDKKRPKNIRKFIARNITKVAQNYHRKITFLLAPPLFNYNEFAKEYTKIYQTPVIEYTKKRADNDGDSIIKSLKKFLKHNHLEEKHLITINFPINRDEILKFTAANMKPSCVCEIKTAFQAPFKTHEQHADEKWDYIAHFQEVKNYYKNIYSEINYGANDDNIHNKDINYDFKKFSHNLHNSLRNNFPIYNFGDQGIKSVMCQNNTLNTFTHVRRIIFIGRIGSGRTTQAAIISYRFGLILVSVEKLITQYRQTECPIGDALRHSSEDNQYSDYLITALLQKRLIQPDCLKHGWVVDDFPKTRAQMEIIYEHFLLPPNKIIFLRVSKKLCMDRIKKKGTIQEFGIMDQNDKYKDDNDFKILSNPKQADGYIAAQVKFYDLHIRDLYDYCKTKKETININGNYNTSRVKTAIWARIEQEQVALKDEVNKRLFSDNDSNLCLCGCKICSCNDSKNVIKK